MFRDKHEHDPEREFSPPPALDDTIRVVMCTSGSPDDIAGRVQRAVGEYSSPSDELHVSHAIAPDPRAERGEQFDLDLVFPPAAA